MGSEPVYDYDYYFKAFMGFLACVLCVFSRVQQSSHGTSPQVLLPLEYEL